MEQSEFKYVAAICWNGQNLFDLIDFINGYSGHSERWDMAIVKVKINETVAPFEEGFVDINTIDGVKRALVGDWIVRDDDYRFDVRKALELFKSYPLDD